MILMATALSAILAAAPSPEISLDVRAREIAPGEPLRIVVTSPAPVHDVHGDVKGTPLFFVGSERRFSAWAVIPLDQSPGTITLAVRARDAQGREVRSSRRLKVIRKTFPEQRLKVEDKYVTPSKEAAERIERERQRLDALYARRTPASPPERAFVPPVAGDPTSAFGLRRFFNGEPRAPHSGIDLEAATGTPVKAAGDGVVVFADDLYFSGKTVILDHGGGLFTIYAHLSEIAVAEDQPARAGATLGLSGATGRVTGPHLHWGARVGATIFDPRALLDGRLFAN